jgi:hypothetical protein
MEVWDPDAFCELAERERGTFGWRYALPSRCSTHCRARRDLHSLRLFPVAPTFRQN